MIYSTIIPLKTKYAASLSLERSQGRPIHLVASLPYYPGHFPPLVLHASRFQTVNISTGPEAQSAMQLLLSCFLYSISLGQSSLSQLSLCHTYEPEYHRRAPRISDYILYHDSPDEYPFNKLVEGLSTLRIKGAQFNWDHLVFSHQLTELHLQDITLTFDSCLIRLVVALSSATQLRDIKFIGVKSSSTPFEEAPEVPQIRLPGLKTLFFRDLRFNTLAILLRAIASRSHCLTLFLTAHCLRINNDIFNNQWHPLANPTINIQELYMLLKNSSVHTLLLDGADDHAWLAAHELKGLIMSMPELKTLKIRKWDFDREFCDALTRPPGPYEVFPNLNSLHIWRTGVWGGIEFRGMIASHCTSLELVELGISVFNQHGINTSNWNELDGIEFEEFWDSLHEMVPHVKRIGCDHEPPEFQEIWWKMWN